MKKPAGGLLFSLALVAVGCGSTATRRGTTDDMGPGVVDMSMKVQPKPDLTMMQQPDDLSMPPTEDLTMGGNGMGQTGTACKQNSDCAMSLGGVSVAAQCLKTDAQTKLVYPNGYCTSPCRPAKSDMATGLNPDCPSANATCQLVSQTAGRCVVLCQAAAQDCREPEGYECENNTPYAASCTPKSKDWCDPKKPMSCPKALDGHTQTCTDFSPDQSYGLCEELCDVFAQDCPALAMGTNDCIADTRTGVQQCIPAAGAGNEGDPCRYLNDCTPGNACHSGAGEGGSAHCRQYCGGPNAVACKVNGQTCDDLSGQVQKAVVGICHP